MSDKSDAIFQSWQKFCPKKNFVRRKVCPKIMFYNLASFYHFNTLEIWNLHVRLPSDVKPLGWSDGNSKKKELLFFIKKHSLGTLVFWQFWSIFTSVGSTPRFACVTTLFENHMLYMFWIKVFAPLFTLISRGWNFLVKLWGTMTTSQ